MGFTIDKSSGSGNATIKVTATANSSQEELKQTLTITTKGGVKKKVSLSQKAQQAKKDFVELLSGKAIFDQMSDGGYVEINQNAGTELLTVEKDGAKLRYQSSKDAEDFYEGEYYFADTDNLDVIAKQMGYDAAEKIPFFVYRVKMRLYKGYCMGYLFRMKSVGGATYELALGSDQKQFKFLWVINNSDIIEGKFINFPSNQNYVDIHIYIVLVNQDGTNGVTPTPWIGGLNCFVKCVTTQDVLIEGYGGGLIRTPSEMADQTEKYQCLIYNPGTDLGGVEIPVAIIDDPSFNRMYFTNKNPVLGEELPE